MREPAQWIEVDGEDLDEAVPAALVPDAGAGHESEVADGVADSPAGAPFTAVPEDTTPTEDVTRGPGPGADLSDEDLRRRIAALLFASPEPLTVARLVSLLERPPAARVRAALEALGHALEGAGLPFQVRGLKGGYTLLTTPELGQVVARLAKGPTVERISAAALETLAIVAYRQPVTKAEIEAIRGVQAGPILRTLVDRGLVKVVGRADVPGHPLQYGTGKEFLDRFGLMGLEELPRDAELARG
jgi:segregation and condensation protein B